MTMPLKSAYIYIGHGRTRLALKKPIDSISMSVSNTRFKPGSFLYSVKETIYLHHISLQLSKQR